MRVFYAALRRRRLVDPAVTAVSFQGSDEEWASVQVTAQLDTGSTMQAVKVFS